MSPVRYIFRSLLHHRFAYAGVLAGAILGATVLLGALFAGDSVKASLKRIGEHRTGRATHVLTAGDRFFREQLAAELGQAAGVQAAPVMHVRGTVTLPASTTTTNHVQLFGVTPPFWPFAPEPTPDPLATRGDVFLDSSATFPVAINTVLARRLNVAAGDIVIIRLQKPGILAGNAPIAGAESALQSVRGKIASVLDESGFGRFSLEATQVARPSVFLPIAALQQALDQPQRANLLLVEAGPASRDIQTALRRSVQLGDYGLSLKWLETARVFELTSSRIFLDGEIVAAISSMLPAAQPVVSYLVNEFRFGERATPYSIATGATPAAAPFLPADLGPREIVLNAWLAEDLQAKAGDEVRLAYFQTGSTGSLVEQNANFRVRGIVPLQGLAADRGWMPDYPGISNVANQSDWDPGLPLDLSRIRDKDERYWDEHRGAPKAFLSVAGGREIWSTRWGNTTALRFALERGGEAELTTQLLRTLRPEMNQLTWREFRASAQDAAQSPVDFAGLFIGMSFFLIVAALGLVALLFQLTLLLRNREDALLGAVGVPARKLLRWRLGEGLTILLLASIVGVLLATLYTRGILRFLESIWAGQGAGETFVFAAQPASIASGLVGFVALSLLAIWLAIRKQAQRALSIRLASHAEETTSPARIRRTSLLISISAAVILVAALAMSGRAIPAQAAFYVAGSALLTIGVAACRWWTAAESASGRTAELDAGYLGALTLKARRSRSLTVVGLIATAVFMVLSVAAFRKTVGDEWLARGSGTGGFAFWVETTAPLNLARDTRTQGFEVFQRFAADLGEIIPLRAGAGDNANCFNLNSTAQPQLIAVDSSRLATRQAFGTDWTALRAARDPRAIPAFVDQTTLMWALKRKVGDVLRYTDESGAPFEVQIVGTLRDSIFQGYLLIDEQRFLEKFPSNRGYTLFLADAQARDTAALATLRTRLESAGRDAGARVELTRDVLAAFHHIENTYIGIFNVLGSLGVLLGSLGLAIVVARNLRERRGEFAVLAAIGIPPPVLGRIVFAEFSRLVVWGIVIGAVASVVAVWPNLAALPRAATLGLAAALLGGIIALNLASGWLIFRWSLRSLRPGMEQSVA